jgi:hypothetical protein
MSCSGGAWSALVAAFPTAPGFGAGVADVGTLAFGVGMGAVVVVGTAGAAGDLAPGVDGVVFVEAGAAGAAGRLAEAGAGAAAAIASKRNDDPAGAAWVTGRWTVATGCDTIGCDMALLGMAPSPKLFCAANLSMLN